MNPLSTRPNRWRPITVFNLLLGMLFSLSAVGQPAFLKEGLVAYYPFNGNANDESGNGNNGVMTGAQVSVDRFGKKDGAFDFLNGKSSVLSKNKINITANESRTVSAWLFASSLQEGIEGYFIGWNIEGRNTAGSYILKAPSVDFKKVYLHTYQVSSATAENIEVLGQWYHLTVAYANNIGSLKVWVNGKQIPTTPIGTDPETKLATEPGQLQIGGNYTGGIDDVRIYNRALSDTEVKALYAYESTPPDNSFITNGLVAYYPFNGNANDESGSQRHLSFSNISLTSDRFGQSGKALKFNNTAASATSTGPELQFGNGARTLTFWLKSDEDFIYGEGEIIRISNPSNDPVAGTGFGLGVTPQNQGSIYVWGSYADIYAPNLSNPFRLKWRFVSIAYNNRVSETSIAIDGIQLSTSQAGLDTRVLSLNTAKGNIVIGGTSPSTLSALANALVDELRIYNRALSDGEVKALYDYESTLPQNNINPRIATATAQVVNGFVVGATITDPGYGYVENPVVTITGGGGSGAKATATQFNGVVTSITITNPGIGYTSAPTITIAPPPFPPRKATSTAQIINGFVVGTKITDGGFGYDTAPAVMIVGGGGSGATAVATVANGVVTAINITNPGAGYTSVPIVRIASPPFAPKLGIETSKVYVRMSVVLGRKYQLEASTDLNTWTTTGPAFIAQDEELAQEFDVNQVGRYFRINQVP